MAMPQRDETIEEIKWKDALLECAVMHDNILINNNITLCMGDKPNEGV